MKVEDLHSDTDYSIWDGLDFTGYPVMTIVKGRMSIVNDKFVGELGTGAFLPRSVPEYLRQAGFETVFPGELRRGT